MGQKNGEKKDQALEFLMWRPLTTEAEPMTEKSRAAKGREPKEGGEDQLPSRFPKEMGKWGETDTKVPQVSGREAMGEKRCGRRKEGEKHRFQSPNTPTRGAKPCELHQPQVRTVGNALRMGRPNHELWNEDGLSEKAELKKKNDKGGWAW